MSFKALSSFLRFDQRLSFQPQSLTFQQRTVHDMQLFKKHTQHSSENTTVVSPTIRIPATLMQQNVFQNMGGDKTTEGLYCKYTP